MKSKYLFSKGLLAAAMILAFSCSKKKDSDSTPAPNPVDTTTSSDSISYSYILGLGITTSSGTGSSTINYAVKTNSLASGTISPVGNGLTLVGYRDYSFGSNTVFAIGGFEQANVNAINLDASGNLVQSGNASFDKAGDDIQQVDDNQMLSLKYPAAADGDQARFYFVDINTKAITKDYTSAVAPLVEGTDQPVYSGMAVNGNKLFVSYLHFDASYNTNYVSKNYIAVYSYPEIKFEKIITDTRTGPTGAWQTKNGLFKTENGDIYAMSSSNLSNGYSQSLKPGGFLRINNGTTDFDASYFFNTDNLGGKISHIKYLGNDLVFATISTIANQTSADRWGDKKLKMSIINIKTQTITDIKLEGGDVNSLIHDGNGGRSFPVLADNGKVYYTATINGQTNIYVIDVNTATAKKGAQVDATFVGGIFKVEQKK